MLKWFHRDKNQAQVAVAPTTEPAVAPVQAGDDGSAVHAMPVELPAETPAAADPVVQSVDPVVPTGAPDPVTPAVMAPPVVESSQQPEPVSSADVATPWWRYEGVWRKAKAPVPVVESPSAPIPGAPSGRDPIPTPPVDSTSGHDQVRTPFLEIPSESVSAAPREPDPISAPAADSFSGDDLSSAPAIGAPAGQDQAAQAAEPEITVPTLFTADEPAAEFAKPRTLRERLAATARALTASVGSLFKRNPKLDEDLLEELETALIQADVGVMASTELVAKLGVRMRKREFADAQALLAALRTDLRALIANYARPLQIPATPRPFVILTVGVNGAGKTTTIGKLAMRYKQAGYSVMLAAGDTFRAAAVEQLKTWGDRNQVTVIAQGSGADSASVIFDAFQAAKSRNIDVLIADTAGRLHTQGHLMQELAKVKRVLGKIDPEAPHETLLVIDGGTGQNALNQAKQFHQAVGLNGIVVTKLDGTAKGGMVFALCRELGLPIRFIGVGEKREDLREFVAEDFVEALLPRELG